MELRKILGQLLIRGFAGAVLAPQTPILRDIKENNLGGVILFDRLLANNSNINNIISPEQTASLCKQLQDVSSAPLLIAVDQEGGKVCRLKQQAGFPYLPSAEQLGKNPALSQQHAKQTARLLSSLGINFNFAPVADLNLNSDNPIIGKMGRAFSHEPSTVTRHCRLWIDALKESGVVSCLKHFPGHGSSEQDSHEGFVDVTSSWQEIEITPYSTLIHENSVEAIMTGHLYHAGFDRQHPASLSHGITTELLRQRLGFTGVVVTDDLQMKAITRSYNLTDTIVNALKAGADLLVFGNNLVYDDNIIVKAIDIIEKAASRGILNEAELRKSFERVQRLKEGI